MDVKEHERLFNSAFIAVLHFTVTVGSSTMNKTHTLKWVWSGP